MEFISIVPVIAFAYQTHEVLLPIYANMRERNISSLVKTTCCCMLMLFCIYSTMGTYGYLAFGSGVKPDIMQMFDGQRPEVLIGTLMAHFSRMIVTLSEGYLVPRFDAPPSGTVWKHETVARSPTISRLCDAVI